MKDWLTAKVYFPIGYPQQKSLRDANFALSSNKREEHLVKLFGKLSPHVKLSGCMKSLVRVRGGLPDNLSCCSDGKESALL